MIKTENLEHSGYISEILIHSYEKLSEIEKALISKEYGRDNKILAFNMETREFDVVNDDFFLLKTKGKDKISFLKVCNLKKIKKGDDIFNSFYELEFKFNIDELSMDNDSILVSLIHSTSPLYLLNLNQINEFLNRNNLLSGNFIINKRAGCFTLENVDNGRFPLCSYILPLNKLIELVENKIRKSDTSCYDKEELNKLMFKLETSRALLYIERESVVNGEYGFWLGKKPKWTVSFDYALEYFSTLGKVNASSFYYFFSATIGSLFDNAIKSGNIVDVPHNYSEFYQKLPLNIYTNIYAMKVED